MANPMLMRALDEVRRFLMPSRGIIMWSGTAADIPTGWALCDGTGGTPDLTDRFILGAGKTYQPGANGGAATATPSVAAGNAQTGIGLGTAAPGGTAGNAKAGIAIWNCALNIWTGAAGTGIGIQGSTLDGNTLAWHNHAVRYQVHAHSSGGIGGVCNDAPEWVEPTLNIRATRGHTPTAFPTPAMPMRSAHPNTATASPTTAIRTWSRPPRMGTPSPTAGTPTHSRRKPSAPCRPTTPCASS